MFRLCLFFTAVWLAAGDTLYFQPNGVLKDVICDDKKTSCPDDSTCCPLTSGGYGCCPLPKAVCCSDHLHCCPAGHKCDVSAGTCLTASGARRPWVLKKPGKSLSAKAQAVICPGGQYQCPNGQTCCLQDGGGYACCPFNKATCCSDRSHCCPQYYKCDLSHGTCVKSGAANVLLGKVQEAASVAAGATTAKKPQHKLNLQTNAGTKQKAKEATPKQIPDPSKVKVTQKVAKATKVPPKVLQQTGGKPIPKTTVKAPKAVKQKVNTATQANVKLKAKVVQTQQGTNIKVQAAPAAKQGAPPKDKILQSKNVKLGQKTGVKTEKDGPKAETSTSKTKQAGKAVKKEKRVLESLKDTIHATVEAIKQTVHRVVGRSGKSDEKVSGKKPAKATKSDGGKSTKKASRKAPLQVTPTFDSAKSAKTGKSATPAKVQSPQKKEKVTPPPKTGAAKTAQMKTKIVTDKKPVASDTNKMQQAKLREVRQKLQKTAQTIQHKMGVKDQTAKNVQKLSLEKTHKAQQQNIQQKMQQQKTKHLQQNIEKQKILQAQKLQQQKIQQQKLQQQKLQQQKLQQQKLEQQKLEQQKLQQQRLQKQKLEQQKLQEQKLQQQKLQEQKLKQEKLQQQKLKEQKLQQQKLQQQKLQEQKLQQQKLQQQKLQEQKLQQQKLQQQKLQEQKLQQQKLQQQKLQEQKLQQQKLQQQKLQEQKLQQQKLQEQKLQQQKLQQQKLEQQKLQQQKLNQQKLQQEKLQQQKLQQQKLQQQKIQEQKLEQQKLQKQKLEQQKLQQQKLQQEKLAQQKLQQKLTQQKLQQKLQEQKFQQQKLQQQKLQQLKLQQQKLHENNPQKPKQQKQVQQTRQQQQQQTLQQNQQQKSQQQNIKTTQQQAAQHQKQASKPKQQQQKQQQQTLQDKMRHKTSKAGAKDVPKKHPPGGGSGNMGTGRRLLGLAWRFLGLGDTESEQLAEGAGEQLEGETKRGWDFDAGMEDEQFVVEGDEFEIVEEDGLELVVGVTTREKIACPDKSTCPDGTTCCQMASGQYGCCPLPNAVCCSDHIHCCPDGQTCDVAAGSCNAANGVTTKLHRKFPATAAEESSVTCPGGSTQCPSGNTCCHITGDIYGCCPLPNAVCCQDKLHCCPQGYTCNKGNCIKGDLAIPWLVKTPAKPKAAVTCPGGGTQCPSGSTCCRISGDIYACCPLPNAVCCPKELTCCPQGYTCGETKCVKGTLAIPWLVKTPSKPRLGVICPGGSMTCPGGYTCCRMSGDLYGCCPVPHAVCCQDELHCCPQGYTCNKGNCIKGNLAIPWLVKTPAKPKAAVTTKMVCPDKKTTCPDDSTCCQVSTGGYGCCPLPNAECCPDKVHCCPQGYLCDPKSALCIQATVSVPFSMKQPARKMSDVGSPNPLQDIVCPDQRSMCPDQATCCQMESGAWGCCPMPNAICCSDRKHCCPQGTKCDVGAGMCTSTTSSLSISHTRVMPRSKVNIAMAANEATPKQRVSIVKCEDQTECPDGDTCCVMSSGKYACCPHNDATCCPDKQHCCPKGYTCGEKADECKKGSMSVSATFIARLLSKRPAQPQMQVMEVKCADSETSCPSGDTCCAMRAGGYGCCALPNAVCCASGSCCPSGHKCDASGTQCIISIPWMKKKAGLPTVTGEEKTLPQACPNTRFTCAAGNTCCPMQGDTWGCCASPDAVCCNNGPYCCPKGLTCSDQPGQCVPAGGSDSAKHAANFVQRAAKGGHILY